MKIDCISGYQYNFLFKRFVRKNTFACLFSIHNIISLHVMNKYA